jgi:hypothetical protein
MKKHYIASLLCLLIAQFTSDSFNTPKFYHSKIFQEETRFSERSLTTLDLVVAGGTKHFCWKGYKGRLDFTELIAQWYQNFEQGFFLHAYVPFCWIKMIDLENTDSNCPPLPHCIHKTDIYSPGLFVGWTLNYEETTRLDFIDLTLECGILLPTPHKAINVPLFPIGYTEKPGFAAAGSTAFGALEWLTTGVYAQAIVFKPATIWSTGYYLKLDHIMPRISFIFAICGDGQDKKIESIEPWKMLSLYFSGEVDIATDTRPWLPRVKGFFSKPVMGTNILKAGLGGFNIGVDAQIIF